MLESGYNEPNPRTAVLILTPSARSIPAKHLELIAAQESRRGRTTPPPPSSEALPALAGDAPMGRNENERGLTSSGGVKIRRAEREQKVNVAERREQLRLGNRK